LDGEAWNQNKPYSKDGQLSRSSAIRRRIGFVTTEPAPKAEPLKVTWPGDERTFKCCGGNPEVGHEDDCETAEEEDEIIGGPAVEQEI
jgi:hypothetical protein